MSKKYLSVALLSTLFSAPAISDCGFTPEQTRILRTAESVGMPFDYRKTLPAIVIQESFVGRYVVRANPNDKPNGSYGVTQIKLETGMWLTGEDNLWKAKAELLPRLIKDDIYALTLAVKKLESVNKGNWIETWEDYNGGSHKEAYARNIRKHIRTLEKCDFFDWR